MEWHKYHYTICYTTHRGSRCFWRDSGPVPVVYWLSYSRLADASYCRKEPTAPKKEEIEDCI